MKPLIEYLVMALVDEPEHVHVEEVFGKGATTYEVHVAPGDQGQVIGKDGRIANALRTIAKSAAMKYKQKIYVEITAPAPPDDEADLPVAPATNAAAV